MERADQCPWCDDKGQRCQWDNHGGVAHNITGLPGVPMEPTPISYHSPSELVEGEPRGM